VNALLPDFWGWLIALGAPFHLQQHLPAASIWLNMA